MTEWQQLADKYYMYAVKRTPLTIVRGKGARVWDDKGKEYLDFVGGWAVNCLGHCPDVLIKALTEQAGTLIQTSNQFYSIPQVQLAELLIKNSCFNKIFISNSGVEANEGAVKLARRYGHLHLNGAYEVITAMSSFHGRTLAMTAATGQPKYQESYIPLPVGFINVAYNDIDLIKKATNSKTCAVMLEVVQGEGGINIPSDSYLPAVRAWCDQKGILLIFDEIQTGIGRTGSLFGYQQTGIEPDIITLAKGLASGVPIGAFLTKEKFSVFKPGDHGSTYGGNPLCSAAAYAVVKYVIDNDVPGNAKKVGHYFLGALKRLKQKYGFITDVRGRGLLLAMEFDRDLTEQVLMECLEKGLLLNKISPRILRFIPPLIITTKDVDEAMKILDEVLLTKSK